jgi:hypothetical protein
VRMTAKQDLRPIPGNPPVATHPWQVGTVTRIAGPYMGICALAA